MGGNNTGWLPRCSLRLHARPSWQRSGRLGFPFLIRRKGGWQRLVAPSLAAVLAAGLVAACSSSQSSLRTLTLSRDLTVRLPAGAPQVVAHRVASKISSRLVRQLAEPERLSSAGPLPGSAQITFHVGRVVGAPFVAWLDHGQWVPVPSVYNAKSGTLSATVHHFSIWAPFTYATSQIQAWMRREIHQIMGLSNGTDPSCGTAGLVQMTDSNPSHHTVGFCASQAMALPAGYVIAKIVNLRSYPVDLFYPASAAGTCGQYGKCVQVNDQGDLWLKLGAALSPGSRRIVLPGSTSATVVTDVPAGKTQYLKTAVDSPAMFMNFLEVGIGVFTTIVGSKLAAVKVAGQAIDALTASQCVSDGWQSASGSLSMSSAESLATAAFNCISSVLPDILDKLKLKAPSLIIGAFTAATSFVSAVTGSLWGEYDTLFGSHVLTMASPVSACPGPTEIAQALAAQSRYKPTDSVPPGSIVCAGPYVAADVLSNPQSFHVLLKQQASGLTFLASGTGPNCSVFPGDGVIVIPAQYGSALNCITSH